MISGKGKGQADEIMSSVFLLQKIVKTKEVKNKMIAYLLQCHLKDYKNVHARTSKPCSWLGVIQQLHGQNFIQF